MICAKEEDFMDVLSKRYKLESIINENLKSKLLYNNSYLDLNIYYELLDNNKFSIYYYDVSSNIEYFKEVGWLNSNLELQFQGTHLSFGEYRIFYPYINIQ